MRPEVHAEARLKELRRGSAAVKYWIFFRDKGGAEARKSGPQTIELSDRAVQRRAARSSRFAPDLDRPVSSAYVAALSDSGVVPAAKSRWLNAVSAYLTVDQINAVRRLPFVREIRRVGRATTEAAVQPLPRVFTSTLPSILESRQLDYGPSETQLNIVNAIAPIERGIIGTGVLLGFVDTLFGQFTHPVFSQLVADGRVIGQQDFSIGPQTNSHGMSVASVAVGYSEGNLVGPAYGASVLAATTEFAPTETNQEEDDFVEGLEWLESQGADIISSSLGYSTFDAGQISYTTSDLDGDSGVTTIAADIATSLGVVVVTSAGNEGSCGTPASCWYYITMPADGDSVIAVGGVDGLGQVVGFSSRGPTADGRIKPDVAALGSPVQVASGSSYALSGGTSFSAPMVSGIVAQMLQVNANLSPFEVREILRSTASQQSSPDNDLGWGIVDADAAVTFASQVGVGPAGVTEPAFLIHSAYPNPSSHQVTITLLSAAAGRAVTTTVYDVLGRLAISPTNSTTRSGRTDINLQVSSLSDGMYFAVVTDGTNTRATTFTVVR